MSRRGRRILMAVLLLTCLALSGVIIGVWRLPGESWLEGMRAASTESTTDSNVTRPLTTAFSRRLTIPVEGASAVDIHDTFNEARGTGSKHEATDIVSPRGTPVVAADDGVVKKLFLSKPGGITLYQFDPTEQYCYYYAHLEAYAPGIHEGMKVKRGQVIAYVGSTGNAAAGAPHLHFAIFALGPEKRWWEGTPIDPFPILMAASP